MQLEMLNQLQKAQVIYNLLINLDIETNAADTTTSNKIKLARELTSHYVSLAGFAAPGLTACAATTLLGVGFCQELAQRFVLEYILKYQEQDVHIIFTHNPTNMVENHAFVVVGAINVPDHMFIGRGTGSCTLTTKPMDINDFFNNNKKAIFVDPLTNCLGKNKGSLTGLFNYFKEHGITEVSGVRSYQHFIAVVQNAPLVKQNAMITAHQIRAQFSHIFASLKDRPVSESNSTLDTDEKDILLRSHGNEGAEKFMFFTNGRDITPGDLPNILASETLTPSDLLQNLVLKIK